MTAPSQPLDAYQLVAALTGHQVDFVVIGGVALQAHGHVRTTLDLDVVAAWTPENMHRLASALRELDAKLRGVDADLLGLDLGDAETLYNGGNFLMHTRYGDLDVFAVDQTAGAPARYEDLSACAIAVEIRGAILLIAHPDDLIRMKTAAARSAIARRPNAARTSTTLRCSSNSAPGRHPTRPLPASRRRRADPAPNPQPAQPDMPQAPTNLQSAAAL